MIDLISVSVGRQTKYSEKEAARCVALFFMLVRKMESYKTIKSAAVVELVEKRSRFIGQIIPAQKLEDVQSFLDKVKAKHWDARHHVPAYLLRDGQLERCSDDGEPSGTAGLPVLEVLRREGLTDCALVVTRYFGGILLGTGGLVRAYSHTAKLAVDAGGVVAMQPCTTLQVVCDYGFYGKLTALLEDEGAVLQDTDFGAQVTARFFLPSEAVGMFQGKLTELSFGRLQAKELSRQFSPIEVQMG